MANFAQVHREARLTWQGRELVLTRPNFGTEAAFGNFLAQRAASFVGRVRTPLGELAYQDALRELVRLGATGEYEWGSRTVAEAPRNPACFRELLYLVITQEQRDFTREQMEQLFKESEGPLVTAWNELMQPDPTPPPQEKGRS